MEKFKQSFDWFDKGDAQNFDEPIRQEYIGNDGFLEWRLRIKDNILCIIQYYADGKGYQIYQAI